MSSNASSQDATAGSSQSQETAAQETPPPVPPFPFSNNPQADLIIRTSDEAKFEVIKAILAAASPVFDDMFTIAQPSSSETATADPGSDGGAASLPTVDVTEDSTTLERLLRFCYPVANPSLRTLPETIAVLEAARKYGIDAAQAGCAEHLARLAPTSPRVAMQVFALACLFGRENLARTAAPHTLGLSLDALLKGEFAEAEELPFACVQRLAAFRRACESALAPLATLQHWIVDPRGQTQGQGGVAMPWVRARVERDAATPCCEEFTHERRGIWGNVETVLVKRWWGEYMEDMAAALAEVHSRGRRRGEEAAARDRAVTSAVLCETCRPVAFKEFRIFEEKLQSSLDVAVAKVSVVDKDAVLTDYVVQVAAKRTFTTKPAAPEETEQRGLDYKRSSLIR
ncbi:hypothetical protein EIP86_006758 [Pleurotus ostreatoroseus]|nr:hypothetical protein EIP86_006758 [Pleurotus ostreatoroseus]